MNSSLSSATFASAHFRARVVKILLVAGAVISGLSLISETLALKFPAPTEGQEIGDAPIGLALVFLALGLNLISAVVYISTAVSFLMWLYRAHKNLNAFGSSFGRLNYSPGWAVGSFFVPFVNLVVPYRAVKEVWQKSIPPDQSMFSDPSPPAWFPIWWLFWLLYSWVGNVSFRLSLTEGASESATAIATIVADALSIVAAIFAYVVVDEIDQRQENTAQALGLGGFAGPPAPQQPFDVSHASVTNNHPSPGSNRS